MSMIIRVGAGVIFSGLFFYVVSLVGKEATFKVLVTMALPVRGGTI